MYIWGVGGIYTTVQPRNRGFFRPRSRNARGYQAVPEGRRPEGTACCPRVFFDRGRKKPRLRRLYCRIEPHNTPYMQYIHHFRLLTSFSNFTKCSMLKLLILVQIWYLKNRNITGSFHKMYEILVQLKKLPILVYFYNVYTNDCLSVTSLIIQNYLNYLLRSK